MNVDRDFDVEVVYRATVKTTIKESYWAESESAPAMTFVVFPHRAGNRGTSRLIAYSKYGKYCRSHHMGTTTAFPGARLLLAQWVH